ncbi:MATE family efflux transporter [Wukongibacter sp. M2B1]|uniref:MATE family efflux transporter n=1 Tax=Wukongibacter sp. M2B1 TaxID=3088895 RepID=UPI003D78CCCE
MSSTITEMALTETDALNRELGTSDIKKLLVKYTVAALIGQVLQMCQITADGIFVGNEIGTNGLATIGIIIPLLVITIATGSLIGVGASSLAAIHLGEGRIEQARSLFGQSIWYSLILSISVSVLAMMNVESIVHFFGATGDLVASASAYTSVFFYGFPFTVTGCVLYFFVRLDEKPFIGILALTVPAVVAIAIEYLCIFKFHIGIASSAIAFNVCVGSWFLIGLYFLLNKETIFKIKFSDIKLNFKDINEINRTGFASFIVQVSFSSVAIVINKLLIVYGKPLDRASFGIINAYMMYIFSIIVTLGFTLGLQPIVSYNYGAKKFARVKKALIDSIKYTIITMTTLTAILFTFQDPIVSFFAGNSPDLIQATKNNMHIYLLLFTLGAVSFVVSGYFQAIEHNKKAIFNGCTRNIIFVVPLLYMFPKFLGLTGIWMALPIADTLSFVVAAIMVIGELKRLNQLMLHEEFEL